MGSEIYRTVEEEEKERKKEMTYIPHNYERTMNLRMFVNNKVPSQTSALLQQEWVNGEGLGKWVDVPMVLSVPIPIKDFKS